MGTQRETGCMEAGCDRCVCLKPSGRFPPSCSMNPIPSLGVGALSSGHGTHIKAG